METEKRWEAVRGAGHAGADPRAEPAAPGAGPDGMDPSVAERATPPLPGPEPAAAPRQPQQERGRRRVDAILDGVAAMVAEVGVVGVTVHGVAKRSGTAIGSIYHFFPDREAMLSALADRHAEAMRIRTEALRAEPVDWPALSAQETVRRFLAPFLTYFDAHPDYLPVIRAMSGPGGVTRRHPELLMRVIEVAAFILRERRPDLTDEEIGARATTIVGVMEGLLSMTLRPVPSARTQLLHELERALTAYVAADDIEAAGSAAARPGPRRRAPREH
ncbi:MAG TPA: TetR family transcriptional regulator [Longimicrobiales bacterium]|nr:TetR family transcriptional regulator [Longimicrobiales bacterium]